MWNGKNLVQIPVFVASHFFVLHDTTCHLLSNKSKSMSNEKLKRRVRFVHVERSPDDRVAIVAHRARDGVPEGHRDSEEMDDSSSLR